MAASKVVTLLVTKQGIRAGHNWDTVREGVAFVEKFAPGGEWVPSLKGCTDYIHPKLESGRLINYTRQPSPLSPSFSRT